MENFTGRQFIDSLTSRFEVSLAPIVKNALGLRLNHQVEAGSDSPFALMATLINTTPAFSQLRDQLGGNAHFRQALQGVIDELSMPSRQFDTVIDVETDTTYDAAALGDVRFNFEISERDVEFAVIQHFSAGDAISIADWDGTGTLERAASDQLVFAFGDIDDFNGAWVVTLIGVDEDLVNDVVALGDRFDDQMARLAEANAWGEWLIADANVWGAWLV